jgi:hypothetical protein
LPGRGFSCGRVNWFIWFDPKKIGQGGYRNTGTW